jgi:peroxiredoxin
MKKYAPYTILFAAIIFITAVTGTQPVHAGSVPDFALKRIDGSTFKLGDHIGKKIIVIDFWATWCKPCKKFLKKLDALYRDQEETVEVLAISTDDASALSKVESYVKGRRFAFTVLLDPDAAVSRIFNPSGKIPFTVIIDKKGDIVYTHTGYVPGFEKQIAAKIQQLEKGT